MSTHTVHPDSHTHGLADDCDRCAEHAEHPIMTLDTQNLRMLIDRVLTDVPARSDNERKAMDKIERVLIDAGHLINIDPSAFCKYILDKWNIRLVVMGGEGS